MAKKKGLGPNGLKIQAWIDARKRHNLTHAHIQMARELGLNPAKLGKIDNHDQEPWKAPLPVFIENLYERRFGKRCPDVVKRAEDGIAALNRKKEEHGARKRAAKRQVAAVSILSSLAALLACMAPVEVPQDCTVTPLAPAAVELVGDIIAEGTTLTVVDEAPGRLVLASAGAASTLEVTYPAPGGVAALGVGAEVALGPSAFFGAGLGYVTVLDAAGLFFEGGLVENGRPAAQRLTFALDEDADVCLDRFGGERRLGHVTFAFDDELLLLGAAERRQLAINGRNFVATVSDAADTTCADDSADCGGALAFAFVIRLGS